MAIAKDAKVILCDEVTSHLDAQYAKKIMTLLADLAHRYHKIVVVSTHDDSAIELCDVIYEIKNKQILLKKDTDCYDEVPALEYTKSKPLPSFFHRVTKSRLKKRSLSYVLSSVVCLLTVTILVFSQEIVQMVERTIHEIHYTIADNEIMIQNNTAEESMHFYIDLQRPFDTKTIQKVSELPFIEKMYPYYGYMAIDFYDLNKNYYFEFTSPQGNHQKVTFDPQMVGGEVIFPYYDEQAFQKKYNSEISGAYIMPNFLAQLGIDNVEEGSLMEMDVYVPSSILYEYEDDYPQVQYKQQHLSLPVAKVLPDNAQDPSNAKVGIYIPYEVFNELNSRVRVEEGQIPYQPSYYKLFVQEGTNRREISRTLQMIDENLCVDDPFWRYDAVENLGGLVYLKVFSQGMLVLSGCLMVIYGFYIDDENRKDRSFYLTRGIGAWRQRRIILGEWFVLWWCVFPLSGLMNLMLLSAKGKFYSYLIDRFPISIGHIMLKTCIIYGVLSFLALVVPMIKAKGGDTND